MAELFKVGGRNGPRDDFHFKVRIGPYRFKRMRLTSDRKLAGAWATDLQRAMDRREAGEPPNPATLNNLPRRLLESLGLVSPLATKRRGTYAENVDDYIGELETAGCNKYYIRNVKSSLTAVAEACGWKGLRDINRDALAGYLQTRKAVGAAPPTMNNIRATVVSFAGWCVQVERLDANPCDSVRRAGVTTDKRRERRALSRDECTKLLAAVGPRSLVYRTTLGTGLRRRELLLLQWRDVRLDDPARPCLTLRTEATKSKRADVLPIPSALADYLRSARPTNAGPTDLVFPWRIPKFQTWLNDLDRAGIVYRGADGSILGFHSLRVTYVTELQKAGLPPRTVMELARHRDYRLTATTYTDSRMIDTFGAVESLPDYTGDERRAAVAMRTGTDDRCVESRIPGRTQIRTPKVTNTVPGHARLCSDADSDTLTCYDNDVDESATISQKNSGFRSQRGEPRAAKESLATTGLLGLEPRTF